MTEVFWVAGADLWYSEESAAHGLTHRMAQELIGAVLEKASARLAWLDQVIWICEGTGALSDAQQARLSEATGQKPLVTWPQPGGSPHYLLHAASRSVLAGDCDLVALAQSGQTTGAAALLASPKAVGRYNLLPRARIDARWEFGRAGQGWIDLAGQVLEKVTRHHRQPGEVGVLSLLPQSDSIRDAFSTVLPGALILTDVPSGEENFLEQLNRLIGHMEASAAQNGLLVTWSVAGLVVVSWVERV